MSARLACLDTMTGRLRLYDRDTKGNLQTIGRTQFQFWGEVVTGAILPDAEHLKTVIQNFRNFPGSFCEPESGAA